MNNDKVREVLKLAYDGWFGSTEKPKRSFVNYTLEKLDELGLIVVEQNPWQPIETLKGEKKEEHLYGMWFGNSWIVNIYRFGYAPLGYTHWQPLPNPPKGE